MVSIQLYKTSRIIISGRREPEGAGPSPLNSVSDSNMCPTENRHFFYLASQYFCLCPCFRVFLYLFPFISVHFSLSLSSIFFFFTHFSFFPLIFFFFLSSVICFVSDTILCPTPGPTREGPEGPPNTPLRKGNY